MGPTTYEILHPETGKAKQPYHVNLLKAWEERGRPITRLLSRQVHEGDCSEGEVEGLELGPLSPGWGGKPVDLQVRFDTFPQLFTQKPGHTGVIQHVIRV